MRSPNTSDPSEMIADDARLLVAIVAGDQVAFAALYDRYGARTYHQAYRVLGDSGAAEDVVQEVFLKVWRRAALFDATRGSVGAWLFVATRHAALDALRRPTGRARAEVPLDLLGERAAPAQDLAMTVVAGERSAALSVGLATLPVPQREAVVLTYFAELSVTEVAARMAVPSGTVKGRLRLARARLRAVLAPLGLD